ncbi:MAG: hypothetical protein KG003_12520 [Bacteroidetes bacterium]|nr:hypothetical protein [Bacteroidota bacterium]
MDSTGNLDTVANDSNFTVYIPNVKYLKRTLTYKQYELSNHLGNVLTTVLDRKTAVVDTNSTGDTVMYYMADVYTAQTYYAFGSSMPGLSYKHDSADGYRFGFNRSENVIELNNTNSYEFRFYNPALLRFYAVDLYNKKYPQNSPYIINENNPLLFVEIDGRDNIIYLIILPSALKQNGGDWTVTELNALVSLSNKTFKGLGLNTKVGVYNTLINESTFRTSRMDPTDGVVVFGSRDEVIKFMRSNVNAAFSKQLEGGWEGGADNPEESENYTKYNPNFGIAIDANALNDVAEIHFGGEIKGSNKITAGALIIAHGAGHNSGLGHPGELTGDPSTVNSSKLMLDGQKVSDYLQEYPELYPSLLSFADNANGRNNDYIESMKLRFGDATASRNYEKTTGDQIICGPYSTNLVPWISSPADYLENKSCNWQNWFNERNKNK